MRSGKGFVDEESGKLFYVGHVYVKTGTEFCGKDK
jgi:hypothetical protein